MQRHADQPPGQLGRLQGLALLQQGHECAFYDTALLFPLNAIRPSGPSLGVAVLDMADPAHPVQTDTLTALPMFSPHESLNLNVKRGLLAAVNGNPATAPGLVAIYDVHADCRHPVLDSTAPVARFGHESGFSPDGNTFYATATAVQAITAIDVTNPTTPHALWQGNIYAHGMSLSDDGNRAYIADPLGGDMLILDTSEIQARKPNPQTREISRLTWSPSSIPQNAIPFTEHGKPYVLEFDEYTNATLNPPGTPTGSARHGSSTSPMRPSRASSPTSACRSISPPTTTRPPATPARTTRRRATRRTTATSPPASTRRSSRARSSPRACARLTSAT